MHARPLLTLKLFGVILLTTSGVGSMSEIARGQTNSSNSTAVVAIDVLIEPDAAMQAKAKSLNELLRKDYPSGFALDASHVPHVSLLHRFVRVEDLPKVYAAAERAVAKQALPGQFHSTGLESAPWGDKAMTSIKVRKTPELSALQNELVIALAPYAVRSGDETAFVRTPDAPTVDSATIDYVTGFVPKRTGENFQPHITAGLSSAQFARGLSAKDFESTFKPAGIAIYQLGNAGTARKLLKRIDRGGAQGR